MNSVETSISAKDEGDTNIFDENVNEALEEISESISLCNNED